MTTLLAVPLSRSYPAVPDSVPRARRTLSTLAAASGAAVEQIEAVRLAVSEAMTGAVVRCIDARRSIRVSAALEANQLAVEISDDGTEPSNPAEHSSGLSGLGLALIAHASDEVAIAKRPLGGTELRMRFRLRGLNRRT
jgi:anti-sigma regulatory factor (Ser/Thr protein kinase)